MEIRNINGVPCEISGSPKEIAELIGLIVKPTVPLNMRPVIQSQSPLPGPIQNLSVIEATPPGQETSLGVNGLNGHGAISGAMNYEMFVRGLNPNGLAVVRAILSRHPEPIGTDELARASNHAATSLPPIMKHIRSTAMRAALDPDEVIRRRQVVVDGRVISAYEIDATMAKEIKELVLH